MPDTITVPNVAPPPPQPCPNDFSKSFEIEAREASRTRQQSVDVANRFFRTVGAVGRTGRFIPTIIDTKYWFAKLYEITTGFEISAARDYKQPGFVLHFIPIFYDMYNRALDLAGRRRCGFTAMARAFHEYRPSRQRFHNGLVERGDDQHHHRRYRSYPWRYGPGAGGCLPLRHQQILPRSSTAVRYLQTGLLRHGRGFQPGPNGGNVTGGVPRPDPRGWGEIGDAPGPAST